ncbi:MAG: sigma-70 factor [Candidatus Scalindua rubra]|uniref:Sigma-70 factor n=1 Tax=Candidatus Scalindua rubra TaxID=1872076 RepID=A0A1E3XCB9_9BACT|nr:MAG: sigma-70 factor [Candidatus Scalindua rubra]
MTKSNEKKRLFVELLTPHKDTLYKVCKNLIWNSNDIEDALQTAILSAYKSFGKFEEGSNFKAWIFKFLINTVFNFNKKYTRLSVFETFHEEILDTTKASHDEHENLDMFEILEKENIYHEILKNPLKLLERMDKSMKDSLLKLNTAERTVFLLRSLTDLSYKEISNVLEIPIGTVMSHLYRARAKLRESLCDYARETGLFRDKGV